MPEGQNVREVGDRIEHLLEEIRGMASPPAWQRVEELMRSVVDLYGAGLSHIVEIVATPDLTSEQIATKLLADKLIESLFLLHGLHPEDFPTRVHKALERVRPYLGSHGGDIELVSTDEQSGAVKLRLGGSCDGCPSSLLTVKLAVETAIRELAPEATDIDVEGITAEVPSASNGAPVAEHSWISLDPPPNILSGAHASTQLSGENVLLCRVGDQLYAYRDSCPSCSSAIDAGELSGDLLTCPSCAERYDVRLAGRSIRRRELHLDPLPLLQDERGVRIAVGAPS